MAMNDTGDEAIVVPMLSDEDLAWIREAVGEDGQYCEPVKDLDQSTGTWRVPHVEPGPAGRRVRQRWVYTTDLLVWGPGTFGPTMSVTSPIRAQGRSYQYVIDHHQGERWVIWPLMDGRVDTIDGSGNICGTLQEAQDLCENTEAAYVLMRDAGELAWMAQAATQEVQ